MCLLVCEYAGVDCMKVVDRNGEGRARVLVDEPWTVKSECGGLDRGTKRPKNGQGYLAHSISTRDS
jgi:hypothetical protein